MQIKLKFILKLALKSYMFREMCSKLNFPSNKCASRFFFHICIYIISQTILNTSLNHTNSSKNHTEYNITHSTKMSVNQDIKKDHMVSPDLILIFTYICIYASIRSLLGLAN